MDTPAILTSTRNPWIRQLRQLHWAKGRREQAVFLAEGTHLLQEAIATQWPIDAVCFTPQWSERHPHLKAQIPAGVRQQLVGDAVLAAIATTQTPDGVVALCQHRAIAKPAIPSLGLALASLQDPGNLGMSIRTAVAAGADGLWLSSDSVDPEHPKVLRASAGQWFRQPPEIVHLPSWLNTCQGEGVQLLAAAAETATRTAVSFWQLDLTQPTLFLLGNEGAGLSDELLAIADAAVDIPMAAGVESLNVGVAGALLLYEAKRQRMSRDRSIHRSNSPARE
ncbi:RNA methyltransferase [Synechococcus sp. PCC 7336]|uniref:TrmH family RNA methyltransferase n=1 Tax=Synechococcus sp. PCC 7336 TaxID=195250 RepID=UPI00034B2A8D|nr:RNA methyltransferase [Synechococcus sp. PCC 7336]